MTYKLYSLDNKFIRKTEIRPWNFTGIIKYGYGDKEWWVNGKIHRLDGPAIEWHDGTKSWWLNDKPTTELECKLLCDIMKLKGLL